MSTTVRIDKKIKAEVIPILDNLGISLSEAINMFLHQVKIYGGIPFELKINNENTDTDNENNKVRHTNASETPSAGKILSEILPYMEIKKEEELKEYVAVPNITALSIEKAKKILDDIGLKLKLDGKTYSEINEQKAIISDQTPKYGIIQEKGKAVICKIK